MLLLIDNRDRWELPPDPEPESHRRGRQRQLPRPGRGTLKLLLALLLMIAGVIVTGIVSDALLFVAMIMVWSAIAGALPYGLGLKEHHQ